MKSEQKKIIFITLLIINIFIIIASIITYFVFKNTSKEELLWISSLLTYISIFFNLILVIIKPYPRAKDNKK